MKQIPDGRRKRRRFFLLLTVCLILIIFISVFCGRFPLSAHDLTEGFCGLLRGDTDSVGAAVLSLRIPRILLALMTGAALSASGAAYQGVFGNAMASPDLLGSSAGAAFGAALAILLHGNALVTTISAFGFSLAAVFLSYLVSERGKGKRILLLILAGILVSSLFSAATSFLKLTADPNAELQEITFWLMGSLSGAEKGKLLLAGIPMLVGFVPLIGLRWRVNILSLGDEEARSLGVDAKKMRLLIILCASLLTAAAVSVCGIIGWVGLCIPHLCRRLIGNDFRFLLFAVMLAGSAFLLAVDDLSRCLLSIEIPIGILTAFAGAPFFLAMLVKKGDAL